jgi:two-component system sensor histidine kinase QseC
MKGLRAPGSLQTRLLVLLLGMVTMVWLSAAFLTWTDARRELDELLDGHLAQAAALLVVQQTRSDDDDEVADAPSLHKYAPKVAFQVFHEGHLVMRSTNAGRNPMSTQSTGFSTVQLEGAPWRVFATRGAEGDVQVFVGEQTDARSAILRAVLRSMLLPLGFALPVLALLVWWAVRRGLMPLRQLSQALGQRSPQSMAPVVLGDMPSEIEPLVQALNALFARIDAMVAAERRFTADAAHELRTPIAAIRAQAQVAMGAGTDAGQRDHALRITLAGCDRATRLVDQLLTLARLEAGPGNGTLAVDKADLCAVTRRVAASLASAAIARRQSLELEADTPCWVKGDEVLISVMVRNLIDNAMRYSPNGARVLLNVSTESGQTVLRVEDSGPGMTDQQIARLGERFYRVLGSDQPGSGLGWSIVKRLADAFGTSIQISRSGSLGGLAVEVRWP